MKPRGIQVVAPFRVQAPESDLHRELADFDWMQALRMLGHSAQLACHCPVYALTDQTSELPLPMIRVQTTERRLMLWTLEAIRAFIASEAFDRDTVIVDTDQLIYKDLAPYFHKQADLVVLVRPTEKHLDGGMPLLNGVQWLSVRAQSALYAFYSDVLEQARQLPADIIRWGADTQALWALVAPSEPGIAQRRGVRVLMRNADDVLEALSTDQMLWLQQGRLPWPTRAVLDFRWTRKRYMPAVYQATLLKDAVLTCVS